MSKLDELARLVGVMAEMDSITEAWSSEDGISESHQNQFGSMIQGMMVSYAIVHETITSEDGLPPPAQFQMKELGCDEPLEVVIILYYTALLAAFQMGRASVVQNE